ncbi:tetratricopeptide repeat protein [uncultured Umboniibacter sp.]|uniref:tetratricopeptide repeat protein n=1 Tax=uncultured Umboniibacter sp. TaxID=1798917 RepID=UPI002626E6F2|nr:tetratricopeptide repeat protein [uncultured Umboniibacter sp.]
MTKSIFAHVKSFSMLSTVLVLSACSLSPKTTTELTGTPEHPQAEYSDSAKAPAKPLPRQMVENLFLADIFAFRGQHQQAAELTMSTAKDFNEPSLAEESLWHTQQAGGDLNVALNQWSSWDSSSDAYLASNARYQLSRQNYGETLRFASQIKNPSLANPFFQSVGAKAMRWPPENQDRFVEVLTAVKAARPDLSGVTIAIALTRFNRFPEQSIELMEQLLEEHPDDEAVVANTAGLLAETGEIDRALRILNDFLQTHQSLDIQTQRLKTEYFDDRVEPDFRPLLRNPSITIAWVIDTANWLIAQGFTLQAKAFSDHLAQRPVLIDRALLLNAEIYLAEQNSEAALAEALQIEQPERVVEVAQLLGRIELNSADRTRVEQWYNERRRDNPDSSELWIQLELGELCQRASPLHCKDRTDAILAQNPSSFSALEVMTELLTGSGEQILLEQYYEEFLTHNPEAHLVRNNLAYSWISRETRLDEAEQQLLIALTAEPENPAYLDSLGWLYYLQGNLDQAYDNVNRASQLLAHPEILSHLIVILEQLGNKKQADDVRAYARERYPNLSWGTSP